MQSLNESPFYNFVLFLSYFPLCFILTDSAKMKRKCMLVIFSYPFSVAQYAALIGVRPKFVSGGRRKKGRWYLKSQLIILPIKGSEDKETLRLKLLKYVKRPPFAIDKKKIPEILQYIPLTMIYSLPGDLVSNSEIHDIDWPVHDQPSFLQ